MSIKDDDKALEVARKAIRLGYFLFFWADWYSKTTPGVMNPIVAGAISARVGWNGYEIISRARRGDKDCQRLVAEIINAYASKGIQMPNQLLEYVNELALGKIFREKTEQKSNGPAKHKLDCRRFIISFAVHYVLEQCSITRTVFSSRESASTVVSFAWNEVAIRGRKISASTVNSYYVDMMPLFNMPESHPLRNLSGECLPEMVALEKLPRLAEFESVFKAAFQKIEADS